MRPTMNPILLNAAPLVIAELKARWHSSKTETYFEKLAGNDMNVSLAHIGSTKNNHEAANMLIC